MKTVTMGNGMTITVSEQCARDGYCPFTDCGCEDERGAGLETGDLVTFSPRPGESAEGIITRVWDKPAGDLFLTLRTVEDDGRTFVRPSSMVVRI